jgi:hypothetical protein
MRKFVLLTAFLAISPTAFAAEEGGEKKPAKASENSVEMPALIAPVAVDGRLSGYFYISSRVTATSATNAIAIREKLAFIQDAFVREVNLHPIQVTDAAKLDRAELGKRLMENARKVIGNNSITGIAFGEGPKDPGIKFSPLHPEMAPSEVPMDDMEAEEAPKPAPKKEH